LDLIGTVTVIPASLFDCGWVWLLSDRCGSGVGTTSAACVSVDTVECRTCGILERSALVRFMRRIRIRTDQLWTIVTGSCRAVGPFFSADY
jgi:hypothetical protein